MSTLTRPDAIHIDVIGDKNGAARVQSLGTASILGILPEGHMWTVAGPGREAECCGTFHVDVEGQTTHIRCVTSGATIMSSRGLVKTLQMMADFTDTPVIIGHDPGASSTIKNAEYTPSGEFAPVAEVIEVTSADITGAEVETARVAIRDNGRVFAAEVHNFGGQAAFDILVESGTHVLITDGDMSRYIRTMRTADRIVITDGLAVWDYNLNPGRVIMSTAVGDGWFNVDTADGRSLMNGERVTTVHPFTRQAAADALTADDEPFEVPAPGEVEAMIAEHDAGMVPTEPTEVTEDVWAGAGVVRTMKGKTLWTETRNGVTRIKASTGRFTEWDAEQFAELMDLGVLSVPSVTLSQPLRTLVNRRKRKASKVNARRVRGGM